MKLFHRILSALLGRDSTIVPAVCYATCNNAYIEAQQAGNSSALCAANSAFNTAYQQCAACVIANNDTTKTTLQTNIDAEFAPFLDLCNAQSAQSEVQASTSIPTETVVPNVATSSANLAQLSASSLELAQAKLSALAVDSSLSLGLGSTVQVTTTVVSVQTVTPSKSFTGNSTSTSAVAAASSPPITKSTSTNHAWIAGAAISPLFAVILGILALWLWRWRKRRNTAADNNQQPDEEKEDMIKAQLHADSLQMSKHELEGHATAELDNERVSELPALEPVGSELSATKKPFIRRKPVGGVTRSSSFINNQDLI